MTTENNTYLKKFKDKKLEVFVLSAVCFFAAVIFVETLRTDYKVKTMSLVMSTSIILLVSMDGYISFKTKIIEEKKQEKIINNNKTPFHVLMWIAITGALIYILGFSISSFVSPLIYYKMFVFKNNYYVLFAASSIFIFVYIVFDLLAGFRLFPGILF